MAHAISPPSNPEALDCTSLVNQLHKTVSLSPKDNIGTFAVVFLSRQIEPRTSYCGSTLSCLRFQHGLSVDCGVN